MRISHYEEVQRFSQVKWLWFVFIALLIVELLVLVPTTNDENTWALLLSIGMLLLPMLFILLVFKYEVKINDEGLHYRFIPKIIRWKNIPITAIESFRVKEKETWFEKIQCGFHRNIFKNTITINITGSKYMVITLRGAGTLKLGTENADSMAYSLKQILQADHE
ncbi:MAG: hypothetical protein KF725_05150 [Cyclobacteriaceae bacterium]|nr:hypothetical protein [Cyclobacteriaceae bacterium]UYN85863.1 MAG: hypothetical protein KIT51_13430 [Cyclobacteriaceae bacterium]